MHGLGSSLDQLCWGAGGRARRRRSFGAQRSPDSGGSGRDNARPATDASTKGLVCRRASAAIALAGKRAHKCSVKDARHSKTGRRTEIEYPKVSNRTSTTGGLARVLVDAGFCVVAFDLHGHGFSDAPDLPLSPEDYVPSPAIHALRTSWTAGATVCNLSRL